MSEPMRQTVIFEIVPHPRHRGDWLLKPNLRAPYGLWYGEGEFAVHYAEWSAREMDRAEIRVYNKDGTRAESRAVGRAAQLGGQK